MNPINFENCLPLDGWSDQSILARTVVAACLAFAVYSSSAQSDQLIVADDGVNTGGVGEYNVTISPGAAAGSAVNPALITTSPAGASTQVRMSVAACQGILYVGEWTEGASTATVGEYNMNGTAINGNLLTVSDSTGAPLLAADGQGDLFVAAGGNLSEYSTSGSLEKVIASGSGLPAQGGAQFTSLALDGSGNLFAAASGGDPLQGVAYHGTISEYTTSGSIVNSRVLTAQNYINSIAVGGGNLFVSYLDGPPDIFEQVSEYTTTGTLVNGALIPGKGGNLALDGQGDLFLDSYGDGTVSAYTTGGTLLTADFLTGVTEAETMAVLPIPEPSMTALAFVATAVAVGMKRRRA